VDGSVATGSVPLVEVRGRVGAEPIDRWDVVIAIDRSESMFCPSGVDVDSDGIRGAMRRSAVRRLSGGLRPHRFWTTDPDDTSIRAALSLARAVIRRLDPSGARVGVILFGGRPRVLQALDSPAEALEALDRFRVRPDSRGTDLAAATYAGTRLLTRASPHSERERILLILSDGRATRPQPAIHARRRAEKAALRAADADVRIHALAVGAGTSEELSAFRRMSRSTGGHFARISAPTDIHGYIPGSHIAVVEDVTVLNRTTGTRARALRLFADGSFDGYVPLDPGENTLEFFARVEGAGTIRTLRRVRFDASDTSTDVSDLERLRNTLRLRSIEIDLANRARAGSRNRRSLGIEIERLGWDDLMGAKESQPTP
jgi:hypothetical protein